MERRTWPLTGRADELQFVDAALRRPGGPRGVVLVGAAGVGKTRLAREALAVAAKRGLATKWAVATCSARELPLGAFAGLLGALDKDPADALPRAMAALTGGRGPAGVVVGVDDAHLLDGVSALLVHQLVLRQRATLVMTVRTGEPAPDSVAALWKEGLLDRREVQPLPEPETLALLERALGGQVDSHSGRRIWQLAQGNALLLQQIVEQEVAAGRLRAANEVWRWSGTPALSPELAELVDARMGALPDAVGDVVDVLALGEPLEVGVLARLTDPMAMESAEAMGLVNVERHSTGLQARLAHPLYGEARRDAIGQLRARRLRGEIATALAHDDEAQPTELLLRRAALILESDLSADSAMFTAAAQAAFRLLDMTLAERLTRAAIASGGGFDARLNLAYALAWQSRTAQAEAEFVALAGLARDDAERAIVAATHAGIVLNILRRPDRAEALLDEAEAAVHAPHAQTVLAAMRAMFHALLGRPERAIEASAAVFATEGATDQAVVRAACGLAAGLGVVGRIDSLPRSAVSNGHAAAARSLDGAVQGLFLGTMHMIGLRLAGYLDELDRVARELDNRTSDAVGVTRLVGVLLLGYASLARGHTQTAVRALREVHSGLAGIEFGAWEFLCRVQLAQALAVAGDAVAARDVLGDPDSPGHPGLVVLAPELGLARAWISAAEGATSEAITTAHQAADAAASQGQRAHEVLALHTAVCFGDRTVADRLADLASSVDGPRAPAAATHAAALATADGDALLTVSERFETIGDLLAAADAAAQAAATYQGGPRRGSATAAAARANRLAEACEGARTPALRAAARPLPLTGREREIVSLAAGGLSNREIADRLTVSVRTVEGHLYRAGAKLGTSDRTEYSALLRDAGKGA
ncbi:MAG: AAA family ATPase [Actinophytocola sp.]|nr:AAA family ATPase [Actinophytocola sp.]